jgi:uncharacterized protein (TIGR00251 family)
MVSDPVVVRSSPEGAILRLRVKPGARRNRLVGAHGGALKLEVAAAPERGKANAAVRKLLAKSLDVPRSSIRIVSGEISQDKSVCVGDCTAVDIVGRLEGLGIDSDVR